MAITHDLMAGHELVVAAQDSAHDLRDERVVTCCMLLFSHRACQKSCIIAAGRERHKAAQQLPPEAAVWWEAIWLRRALLRLLARCR
jgi:hypothetical protein